MKAALTIMIIIALGLGAALLLQLQQRAKDREASTTRINQLERSLEDTKIKLDDQERISLILRTNLNLTGQELQGVSNNFLKIAEELRRTQTQFKNSEEAARAAQAEVAKKDAQISELENQGTQLNGKITDLESSMKSLNKQIASTESQLAAAEGDREFLLKELKRLQSEKAELERQFNDLSFLRGQLAKLKEELSISRRLEWIRMGIYGQTTTKKGTELLMTEGLPASRSNYNLNVELRQDGGATIVPPQTNAPPKP